MAQKAANYTLLHKAVHWILFALVIAQFTSGFIMPDPTSIDTVEGAWLWHLGVGPTILVFALINLILRIVRPVALPDYIPAIQRKIARITHDAMLLLLIVIPPLGWAAANSNNMDPKVFGLVALPRIAAPFTPWADIAGDIHILLVYVLLGFIVLHVAAALYHLAIARDGVMKRML